jgi:hypothetical protein
VLFPGRTPAGCKREPFGSPLFIGRRKIRGTRFLKEAGFPRTPSGKNFYMFVGRSQNIVSTVTYGGFS